jgi:RNA polymerase sigma-70 factor (ECF subfamily)
LLLDGNWKKQPYTMPLTDPTEDLALLTQMRNGDAAAFAQLYRRHQGPLYRFALLRCSSSESAADVVQEIFLALLNNTLKFDPSRGVLQGFLFGVARNLVLKAEQARYRFVPNSPTGDDDPNDLLVDPAPEPPQRLLDQQEAEAVRCALQRLAPHYRDVIILYEMHDLSYVEIAQICEIDIGTVRSRLSRARAKLVELLLPDFPEEIAPASQQLQSYQQKA